MFNIRNVLPNGNENSMVYVFMCKNDIPWAMKKGILI